MSTATLREAFVAALGVPPDTNVEAFELGTNPEWDSLAHMSLVAELEERFGVALDTDELIAINSFPASVEVLRRHGVAF